MPLLGALTRLFSDQERVITKLSDQLHEEYIARHKNTTQWVLFESTQKGGMMYGYTGNYIRVERPYDKSKIGNICEEII